MQRIDQKRGWVVTIKARIQSGWSAVPSVDEAFLHCFGNEMIAAGIKALAEKAGF